ncbi:hypothetical protein PILCRDRAFT_88711 [Piloderma croceum F 1598]|uniref:Uncharacterized protein n=1 Tax=Piloderma croceum (strain F 1598) TaxID=765440 RepID=A0A0C3FTU6_PILCF|nr:hypothetical protein PILCRDRAFT_88711 [Piloderma croceum F 1598]
MARPNHPATPAISYGKLVYPPGEYTSSGDTFVNTTPKFVGNEDFMPDYITCIVLPHALNKMQATRRLELENLCALHAKVRNEYFFAYMLHQEALKAAQSSEKRANKALAKLHDVSAHVTACMATAFCDLELDEKPGSEEPGSKG